MRGPAAATLLTTIALGLGVSPIEAHQTTEPVPNEQVSTETQPARENPAPVDRFGLFEGGQLQISTGTDDDTLTFRAALPTGPSQRDRFALTASTPLHGGDGALPASLDALANGTRVTLSWGRFGLAVPRENSEARDIRIEAVRTCENADATPARCIDPNYAIFHHDRPRYLEYIGHLIPSGATDIGFDATIGVNDFEWIDPVALTPRKERHTDWSVAGHVVHYFAGSIAAVTGSVSYQRAYEAAGEQLLCPPNPTNPAAQCVTGRGAAPSRNENFLLSLGGRYRFVGEDGLPLNFAVAPEITYDVIDDVFGVDVPVYLTANKDGNLTGGIRFGYRSDRENEFSVGVFVGTAFGIP